MVVVRREGCFDGILSTRIEGFFILDEATGITPIPYVQSDGLPVQAIPREMTIARERANQKRIWDCQLATEGGRGREVRTAVERSRWRKAAGKASSCFPRAMSYNRIEWMDGIVRQCYRRAILTLDDSLGPRHPRHLGALSISCGPSSQSGRCICQASVDCTRRLLMPFQGQPGGAIGQQCTRETSILGKV